MSLFYRLMRRLENSSATIFELIAALAGIFLMFTFFITGIVSIATHLP